MSSYVLSSSNFAHCILDTDGDPLMYLRGMRYQIHNFEISKSWTAKLLAIGVAMRNFDSQAARIETGVYHVLSISIWSTLLSRLTQSRNGNLN